MPSPLARFVAAFVVLAPAVRAQTNARRDLPQESMRASLAAPVRTPAAPSASARASIETPPALSAGTTAISQLRIPVAAHDIARGTLLSDADITWSADSTLLARVPHTENSMTTALPGWIARRAIRAGELLVVPSVSLPDLVKSGDAVDVVYHDDGIVIKLRGVAIGNGAYGDTIYVKLDNRRRLRGIVDGENRVKIP